MVSVVSFLGDFAREGITFHRLHSSDFPIINVSYSLDVEYEYLPGADEIELLENGESERVWTFDGDHAPASIVMIIDSSGSMKESMGEVLTAASSLIRTLPH